MKCPLSFPVIVLGPALVAASAHDAVALRARQATTSAAASSSSTSAASVAASGASSGTGTAVIGSSASGSAFPTTLTFSLLSSNPTAIPLSDIQTGTVQNQSTIALSTTYQAGATQTWVPNAPPLPTGLPVPSNYPKLDVTPPTDSPEVQQWIQQVLTSGVDIPDIPPTNPGACANNTAAVANATQNCWWTCGGCTRDTDVAECPTKNAWGVSYDDGPSPYTPNLLQYFAQQDLRATFFTIGSRLLERPAILQDEYMTGNQIAVHTWSHPYMTTKTTEQVIAELGWTKKLIKDTLGVTPIYWRPPYGDIDDRVRAISTAMNLIPIVWTRISKTQTFDTNDWSIPGGKTDVYQVLDNWQQIMGNSTKIDTGFIVLEHDLFEQTVDVATGYILPQALAHTPKYNMTPIIECLNQPLANAYLETNDNASHTLPLASVQATHTGPYPTVSGASGTGSAGAAGSSGGSDGSGSGSGSGALGTSINSALLTAMSGAVLGAVALLMH